MLFAYFVSAVLPYLYTPTGGASSSANLSGALPFPKRKKDFSKEKSFFR